MWTKWDRIVLSLNDMWEFPTSVGVWFQDLICWVRKLSENSSCNTGCQRPSTKDMHNLCFPYYRRSEYYSWKFIILVALCKRYFKWCTDLCGWGCCPSGYLYWKWSLSLKWKSIYCEKSWWGSCDWPIRSTLDLRR